MDTAPKEKGPALSLVQRRHAPEQAAARVASVQRQADQNLLMRGMEPGPVAGFFYFCQPQNQDLVTMAMASPYEKKR